MHLIGSGAEIRGVVGRSPLHVGGSGLAAISRTAVCAIFCRHAVVVTVYFVYRTATA